MPRTLIVSNRTANPAQASQAGGVSVALSEVCGSTGGIWLGWSGEVIETREGVGHGVQAEDTGGSELMTIPLTAEEHRDYYLGYANSVLWPTFHNRLDLALFEGGFFASYADVNERFADIIQNIVSPDDVIWVHDYHFLLLAERLRQRGMKNPIGFFLHIPFPPAEAFLAIPEYRRLAHALAAYDLVGLQTTADTRRLVSTLETAVAGRLTPDGRMRVGSRLAAIEAIPIGIDWRTFATTEANTEMRGPALRLVSADRLDYTKGLPQKFRAFGRFLERNETYRGRVVLTQIAAPSRESVEAYSDLKSELETICGAINGRYGELDWVPIYYMNRSIPRSDLGGIYRSSRIGLVTPLADGMNIVAKEYIAAQDPEDPGVLILSRFAGAAAELTEAVIVNPYDLDDVAEAIRVALELPLHERVARHMSLLHKVQTNGAREWAARFVEALIAAAQRPPTAPTAADATIARSVRRLSAVPPSRRRDVTAAMSAAVNRLRALRDG